MLFGHHFAAITGAGPLIGPVLASQFGFAPGLLWIVGGVCLAGSVHDTLILWASTRRRGASLAAIARSEIGPVAGFAAAVAILFIIVIALAGLGLAVVNALSESAWGVFTIAMTIPLALVMSLWLLLCPRDYLSSFMKIGTIAFLIIGVAIVNPVLQMPAFTSFTAGGGPIVPGALFPFAFITIACGAISGFHALIGSGTTPKMVDRECDIRPIAYGAMLIEGVVGVLAIVAACSLHPGDYLAINTSPAVYATRTSYRPFARP